MTVQLTEDEKLDFFYRALCNGLDYISGYGLQLKVNRKTYDLAKDNQSLTAPCLEDVLMQVLKDGNSFSFKDLEGDEDALITLELVLANMDKVETETLLDMANEQDDAITADIILQTVAYGEVQFG